MAMSYSDGTRLPIGIDNGCFKRFEPDHYLRMLIKAESSVRRTVFATLPDVVADWQRTLDLFDDWKPEVWGRGFPVCLVAQDGLVSSRVPWNEIDALFIGGSTEWKLGRAAADLAREAKTLRKYVHMGRVNSYRRFRHAYNIGCDSVDGGQFSWFPDTHIPRAMRWLEHLKRKPPVFPTAFPREHRQLVMWS